MKVALRNIGCISDVEIIASGLTVISGLNNTGKSTILKAIYSTLSPAIDFESLKKEEILSTLPFLTRGSMDLTNTYEIVIDDAIVSLESNNLSDEDRRSLDYIKALMNGDMDLDFFNRLVKRKIRAEFYDLSQFKNLGSKDQSDIRISDGLDYVCQVDGNDDVKCTGNINHIPRVVYYDSPFNVDSNYRGYYASTDHRQDLSKLLSSKHDNNIIMESAFEQNVKKFDSMVESAISGAFIETPEGLRYRSPEGHILSIRNVAAGAKVFGIIRRLVDKGYLRKGSILLLDEPEVHLHPQWINILAESLVILVKDLGIKVIMTTHNPQLMMAVESLTRKVDNLATYYLLSRDDDGNVHCDDVTDHLEDAYQIMSDPVQEVASRFWE